MLMQLNQTVPTKQVSLDVLRRDKLWQKEAHRESRSPHDATLYRIKGLLKIPKFRGIPPAAYPKQLRTQPVLPTKPVSFQISVISANSFHHIMNKLENEFFTTSLYEINRLLEDYQRADVRENAATIEERLPSCYYPYRDVFSLLDAEVLPEHRTYDYNIVLEEPLPNSYSPLYKQNWEELKATKEYV